MKQLFLTLLISFTAAESFAGRWEARDINRDGQYVCHPIAADGSVLPNRTGDFINCTAKYMTFPLINTSLYGCFPVDARGRTLTKFPVEYSFCNYKYEALDGNRDGISNCYVTDGRGRVLIDAYMIRTYRKIMAQSANRLNCQMR